MRKLVCVWMGTVTLAIAAPCMADSGLKLRDNPWDWDNLKGRLSMSAAPPLRSDFSMPVDSEANRINSVAVMGDYYVTRPSLSSTGGLRATSGVLLGTRSPLWGSPWSMDRRQLPLPSLDAWSTESTTTPYVGMGYTGISAKSGWAWSADLGVMALNPRSAVRLGRVVGGSQSLDDTVREMRLAPVLQLGVSYAF